jgi:hypothetical protein
VPHEWRKHPALLGRFHPEHADDLQVLVHDGGPRISDRKPELVWVTLTASHGEVFTGKILSRPSQLQTVNEGDEIRFIVPRDGQQPLYVSEKYLRERPDWIIHPCKDCGLSELFDAPSELMKAIFPDLPDGAVMESFTAMCGMCGGVKLIQYKDAELDEPLAEESPPKWWQFWK